MSRDELLKADALIEEGLRLYSGGRLDQALERWRAALRVRPDVPRAGEYIQYVEENRVALERSFGLQAGGAAQPEPADASEEDDFDIDVEPVQTGQVVGVEREELEPPAIPEDVGEPAPDEADEDTSRILLDGTPFAEGGADAPREFAAEEAATPLRLIEGGDEPAGLDFEPMEPTPVGIELPEPARIVPAGRRSSAEMDDLLPALDEAAAPAEGKGRQPASTSETLLGVGREDLARKRLPGAPGPDPGFTVEAAPGRGTPSAPHGAELYASEGEEGGERLDSMLAGAWQLHEQETFEGSLWLCQRILAIDPDNREAGELLERNRQALLEHYEARLENLDAVPVVKVPQHEVVWHKLDHRAGFLLSRVDGMLSFGDILDISGMSRFEACRILAQLLEQGVIGPR